MAAKFGDFPSKNIGEGGGAAGQARGERCSVTIWGMVSRNRRFLMVERSVRDMTNLMEGEGEENDEKMYGSGDLARQKICLGMK